MGFFKNITTGVDNETHDIIRVAMTAIICALIAVLFLGVEEYLYSYCVYVDLYRQSLKDTSMKIDGFKLFDIQTFFTSTSTYAIAAAGFLVGGSASILLKKSTEPQG